VYSSFFGGSTANKLRQIDGDKPSI